MPDLAFLWSLFRRLGISPTRGEFAPLVSQNLIGRLDFYFEDCTTVSRVASDHLDIMEKCECDSSLISPEIAGIGIWGYPSRLRVSYDDKEDMLIMQFKRTNQPAQAVIRLQGRLIFYVAREKPEIVGVAVRSFKKLKHSEDIPLPK